jgi:nuclear receptor subfamily 6 group A
MPGGRNSGAVYNLYKVKYKKHKKSAQKQGVPTSVGVTVSTGPNLQRPEPLANGTILKTALTNPSEIVHLRQRLDSAVSSSSSREREWERDRNLPAERAAQMIQALIDCDAMEDIATVQHLPDLLEDKSEIGDKLCKIGDSIVHKMVAWTKKLPFILEIPMKIHSKLLMDKWHEISVLTTAAYQAMHGRNAAPLHMQHADQETELSQEASILRTFPRGSYIAYAFT